MAIDNKLVDYFNRLLKPLGELDGLTALAKHQILQLVLVESVDLNKDWVNMMEAQMRSVQQSAGQARGILWELGKAVRRMEENKLKRGTKKKVGRKK